MEYLKEALQYAIELSEPRIQEIEGQIYSDKPLHRINHMPKAKPIMMNTLTGLIDYIKANIDAMSEKMIVHVENPEMVSLYSMLNEERDREYIAQIEAKIPSFPFGKFTEHESFCIGMQSKFIAGDDTDLALVLKFAGTVEDGTVAEYGDDGVTQKATVKTGISSKADAVVPNPVKLRPYRTFIEVQQPVSDFIFRMKSDKYEGIQCAIFEADGGAWKNVAMKSIKEYLQFELEGMEQFTVIS